MARIRSLKPEFWADEKLGPMSDTSRLVFLGLISMADDAGRLLDSVKVVDAFVFPYTDSTSGPALEALAKAGRIVRGLTASGQRVIQIVNWSKHQRVDHPNLLAALPEVVADHSVNDVPEPLASESGTPRASIYDLRPTTYDLRPTSERSAPPRDANETAIRKAVDGDADALAAFDAILDASPNRMAAAATIRRLAPGGTLESADVTWPDIATGMLNALTGSKPYTGQWVTSCIRKAAVARTSRAPTPADPFPPGKWARLAAQHRKEGAA